jgi:raffinose/stachyose/melibiose transport system permease protein
MTSTGIELPTRSGIPPASGGSLKSPRKRRRVHSVGKQLWWFALPGAAVYMYVMMVPTVQGLFGAFTDWSFSTVGTPEFIGLDNFNRIFTTDAGDSVARTLQLAFVVVVLQNVVGLALALLLNGRVFGRNVLRTIVSSLVVGYLFKYIFGPPGVGGVNQVLAALGQDPVDFLGNPSSAMVIIVVTILWQSIGGNMVIYLAGLQGVPVELEEAAALDGAGYWKRFWFVVRPLLAPAITINLMLGLIGGMKIFDQIFSLTNGGPGNSTQTISTLIYAYFSQYADYGRSAALALLLAIAIAILSVIQFSVLRRQERS